MSGDTRYFVIEKLSSSSLFRDAAHQLLIKASRVFKPDKKKKKRVEDADFVCVHIRRLVLKVLKGFLSETYLCRKDHLEFEAMNKMPHLSRGYFIQVKFQLRLFLPGKRAG